MAKHFKLKFPRVNIPLIQFCRPKHSATLPAIYRLSPVNAKAFDIGYPNLLPAPPPSTPEYSSARRRVPSKTTKSIGCGSCRSRSCTQYTEIKSSGDHQLNSNNHMSPISETEMYYKKKRKEEKKTKKKKAKAKAELPFIRTSSGNFGNWFSGEFERDEEKEESGTPIYSSRSFSNEFSLVMESISEKMSEKQSSQKKSKKKSDGDCSDSNIKKVRRLDSNSDSKKLLSGEIGKIKTVLRPMKACRGKAGKVRESVAVVKKSEDPYDDFKRSMMEMVMEKQIFEAKELEELLLCFLTLNSRHYQGVIVEAFSEIWDLLFSDPPLK